MRMEITEITIQQAAAVLGRRAGQVKSARKAKASRKNGKLGGRPKSNQPKTNSEQKA